MGEQSSRRGPRGERGQWREIILHAAQQEFFERGYEEATLRSIGERAGCNPSLVVYYYGPKEALFRAAMNLPEDPAEQILALLAPGWDGAATRLLAWVINMYETQLTAETMNALLRSLVADASTAQRFTSYVTTNVLDKIKSSIRGGNEVAAELELLVSMVAGTMLMRYVVGIEPLASMPPRELITRLAPMVQTRCDRVAELLGQGSQGI